MICEREEDVKSGTNAKDFLILIFTFTFIRRNIDYQLHVLVLIDHRSTPESIERFHFN